MVTICVALVVLLVLSFEALRRARLRLRFLTSSERALLTRYLAGQDTRIQLGEAELSYLRDAVVLVAGAGSSIAGELIKKLTTAQVRTIVVLDNNENALYRLRQRFLQSDPSFAGRMTFELANIRDGDRMAAVFGRHQPTVVFHFASYKSASLGNISPYAFVKVNVEGTYTLLEAASGTASVRRFVYVSSDKAYGATQTYGRTKLLAEMLVRARAEQHPGIRFSCIRYCNVLDAAGSFAIPTFRRQIAAREKVTIRRFVDGSLPDRYYIPLELAAELTLFAGTVAGSGNVLSLDSARVRALPIDELARMLARSCGVRNVRRWMEQNVRFIDPEPGEKRSEVLGSGRRVTGAPLVELAMPAICDPARFAAAVAALVRAAPDLTAERLAERVRDLVDGRWDIPDEGPPPAGHRALPSPQMVPPAIDRRAGSNAQ
jgi:FlaA1/EpsC-like NDP-sugar epimerase